MIKMLITKIREFITWGVTTALMISFLIICQHFLKNKHMNPSGPRAFSTGMALTVASTSCSEKGSSR
jgi:hypothetical protein